MDQHAQILNKLYTHLIVPRWHLEDDQGTRDVVVRYGPTRSAKVEQSLTKRSNDEHAKADASLLIHADLLIDSCLGIFFMLDGDLSTKYPLRLNEDGTPVAEPCDITDCTKFDKALGKTLGMTEFEASLATSIVRKLYITDGDLIDASNRVSTWSTEANEKAEEDFI
jgi:hypothetical protein